MNTRMNISLFAITLSIFTLFSCNNNNASKKNNSQSDELKVNNYILVATGQTSLYDENGNVISKSKKVDSLYGQDANYLKGRKMSYNNNEDGTITDLNTGLMWQQIPCATAYTWQGAVDYCNKLELANYSDWRMPSCKELYSISDFSEGWPYLNTEYFNLVSDRITKNEQYWTSDFYVGTVLQGKGNVAFGVNHATGHIKAYPADVKGPIGEKYVRAVRGSKYGINDFVENGDRTISDKATRLMWSQDDSGEGMSWKNALKYAQNSKIAAYSDWRLPNVKELQSIVDYSYSPSANDPTRVGPAIDPVFSCTSIINENEDSDYAYYWTSTSAHFRGGELFFYAWYVAFGRAVNAEGKDFHGAGAVRFDAKCESDNLDVRGERYDNFVRLVRDIKQ